MGLASVTRPLPPRDCLRAGASPRYRALEVVQGSSVIPQDSRPLPGSLHESLWSADVLARGQKHAPAALPQASLYARGARPLSGVYPLPADVAQRLGRPHTAPIGYAGLATSHRPYSEPAMGVWS